MAARGLIFYPDSRLRAVSIPIQTFGPDLADLAKDLVDTLHAVSAIGLTAAHFGRPERITAIRPSLEAVPVVYVNPQIIAASTARSIHVEGSVSMPGISERVERASRIGVRYADCSGAKLECEAEGFLAACLQHEIDQLDGIFWIHRLPRMRRERAIKRFAELRSMTA